MATNQALVKTTESNGNGLTAAAPLVHKQTAQVPPLTEELVDELLAGRGFRGWLRAARVARVLGLFSLYLFLDTYDVRADFNRRAVARPRLPRCQRYANPAAIATAARNGSATPADPLVTSKRG